jgi:hypothetical protein
VLGGYLVWRVRVTGSSSGSGSELELGLIFYTSYRTETKCFGEELDLEPDSRSTVVDHPTLLFS